MGEFAEAVRERAHGARAGLEAARRAEDAYAMAVAADDLDAMLRLAREHGIELSIGGAR